MQKVFIVKDNGKHKIVSYPKTAANNLVDVYDGTHVTTLQATEILNMQPADPEGWESLAHQLKKESGKQIQVCAPPYFFARCLYPQISLNSIRDCGRYGKITGKEFMEMLHMSGNYRPLRLWGFNYLQDQYGTWYTITGKELTHLYNLQAGKVLGQNKTIKISWAIPDVVKVARSTGYALTLQDMLHVLAELKDNHDANHGITWETIESCIEMHFTHRKLPAVPYDK